VSALLSLLRTRTSVVWLVLVSATFVSWQLGAGHEIGVNSDTSAINIVILLVAFFKVRFVGLYFMELRDAPRLLRALFEGYCLMVCALVLGMTLSA
jgi:Prokaryotic Cytochrome C oxidase subunit IV